MEIGDVKDLSKYRYEKALSNISIAKNLFATGAYGVALNRAYYSAFDAMRAVNALDGFDSSKHSGVISHFNQEYVKSGLFPITTSSIIRKAHCSDKSPTMRIFLNLIKMKLQMS